MSSLDDHNFDVEGVDAPSLDDHEPAAKKGKKKRDNSALRKAPQAPKRFKSSYICFFIAKQPEIKEELGDKSNVTAISKRSAEMWKNLPPEERAHWDNVAAKDKERYMVEKASYTGPWQVPFKRARKDPSAPKRPMSAFLYFSQGIRARIKSENPEMKNTQVSRILGEMWRNLSPKERHPHVEKEKGERAKYKIAIAEWKKKNELKQEAQRKAQADQQVAMLPDQSNPYGDFGTTQNQMNNPYSFQGYPYSYPAGPYVFPTNGKQPVVLGPNGTPHYPLTYNEEPVEGRQTAPPAAAELLNAPTQYPPQNYDGPGSTYDYRGVQGGNDAAGV